MLLYTCQAKNNNYKKERVKMNKNLKNEMVEIVNKEVEAYRSDLEIDFNVIKNNKYVKKWVWMIRRCGTNIFEHNNLQFNQTEEFKTYKYYVLNGDYKRIYIIDLQKNELIELDEFEIKNIVMSAKNIDYKNSIKLIKRFYNEYKNELNLNDMLYNIKRLANQYGVNNIYQLLCDIGIIDKNNINSNTFKILDMIEAV
jgi:hypothetical protein